MRKFSLAKTKQLATKYRIDLSIVPLDELANGFNIEREHIPYLKKHLPSKLLEDAVVNIALAHLEEDPRYYKYLDMQERKREEYWSKRRKPKIYISE